MSRVALEEEPYMITAASTHEELATVLHCSLPDIDSHISIYDVAWNKYSRVQSINTNTGEIKLHVEAYSTNPFPEALLDTRGSLLVASCYPSFFQIVVHDKLVFKFGKDIGRVFCNESINV